jgi:hypothetical protein
MSMAKYPRTWSEATEEQRKEMFFNAMNSAEKQSDKFVKLRLSLNKILERHRGDAVTVSIRKEIMAAIALTKLD